MATAFQRSKALIEATLNKQISNALALEIIQACANVSSTTPQAESSRAFLDSLQLWMKKRLKQNRAKTAKEQADQTAEDTTNQDLEERV